MELWTTFWGLLLIVTLGVYGVVAVVVTIGGFADIRTMLRRLDEQHASDDAD